MAYNEFGDPSFNYEVLKKKEAKKRTLIQIKHEDGCGACEHRESNVFGIYWTCKRGNKPNKHNYCREWWLDESKKYG